MNRLLERVINECRPFIVEGAVANYIPELERANRNDLGIAVCTVNGEEYAAGDCRKRFTMQSTAKVLTLLCCLKDSLKAAVLEKVSLEPTSDGFNSIVNLETKNENKPLNPFINSGSIACITLIKGNNYTEKYERVLDFMREVVGNDDIGINESVYMSEKENGSRNRALAYYMKSTGVIDGDVEDTLDAYFKICSIEVTCGDLARLGAALANDGIIPASGKRVFSRDDAKTVKASMALCGMYNESGKFAVSVGVPGKSGVSGAILCAVPKRMGIAVYGPSLNNIGTSVAGLKCMEVLADELDLSVF